MSGIVATSANCIEMFNEREQYWQDQINVVSAHLHCILHFILPFYHSLAVILVKPVIAFNDRLCHRFEV